MAHYSFDDAAINSIFTSIENFAQASGRFDSVNGYEPKSAPGDGVHYAVWMQSLWGIRASGLKSLSGLMVIHSRVYMNFRSEPFDGIDPKITAAAVEIMGAVCGDFDFGDGSAEVRNVDILGTYGTQLSIGAGYVEIDRTVYRVMTIVTPVVINDMFQYIS